MVASGTFKELQELGDEFTAILQETENSYKSREIAQSPTSTTPHHRKLSQQLSKGTSRQNSVQQPSSPTMLKNRPSITSTPKAGIDSVPKLDFRSPSTDKSEATPEQAELKDFESYRKAVSRTAASLEAAKQSAEMEKLLKKPPEELPPLTEDDGNKSFSDSTWSLDQVRNRSTGGGSESACSSGLGA